MLLCDDVLLIRILLFRVLGIQQNVIYACAVFLARTLNNHWIAHDTCCLLYIYVPTCNSNCFPLIYGMKRHYHCFGLRGTNDNLYLYNILCDALLTRKTVLEPLNVS